jgi:hypothetical protein
VTCKKGETYLPYIIFVSIQRDALFTQFIKNYGPLHVSSITCSSSGGAKQAALGILFDCYVSGLHQEWIGTQFHSNPVSSQLT